MSENSVFSVIMPVFNKQAYIFDAVQSVLRQTYSVFELLIVDDGSTDNSIDIVKTIKDERIHIISQKNGGVSVARNRGMEEARGDYFCFIDSDDLWESEYLTTVLRMIKAYHYADCFTTGYYELINDKKIYCQVHPQQTDNSGFVEITDFYKNWSWSPFTFTSAITIRRQLFDKGVRFPAGESAGEDQEVWFTIAEASAMVFCPIPLVAYRREVINSLTSSSVDHFLPCYLRLAERVKQLDFPGVLRGGALRLLAKHRLDVAWVNILAGNTGKAFKFLTSVNVLRIPMYFARCVFFILIPSIIRPYLYSWLRSL